jgi:hypothetical protein
VNRSMETKNSEHGYALLAFVVVIAIGLFLTANALTLTQSSLRSNYAARMRSDDFMRSDESIGAVLNWFRAQSLNLITPFKKENFYSRFNRGTPSVGTNDIAALNVPTKVKLFGTTNSAILVSSNTLGTAAFPSTQHLNTNATFNTSSAFSGASFGDNIVRATLVDAVPVDPSKNYGPPPAAAPETDFYPIYRLDVLRGLDQGAHLLGYMVGTLFYIDTIGFYGRDFVEARQSCDSYISANGPYGPGSKRAHCPVGSNGTVMVHQNEHIFGSVRTNSTMAGASPYGGTICGDFSCTNPGNACQGTSCNVPGLPTFSAWTTYCPTNQGDRNVTSNQTWTVAGSAPNQKCWNTVTLSNNRILTLSSTGPGNAYFIRTLNIPNNARLNIAPSPASGTVYLYVESMAGGTFNGNQVYNANNRPSQFRIYYLGTQNITMNGTAVINSAMVAPYAGVTVQGNFTYSGGILAESLTFTGSGALHYDESLGGSEINDLNFRLRDKIQYYN